MIVSYSEVTSAYQSIKGSGVFAGAYIVAILIGGTATVINLLKTYQKSLEEDEPFQTSTYIKMVKPMWKFVAVLAILPFALNFVESIFGMVETTTKSGTVSNYFLGMSSNIYQEQLRAWYIDYEKANFFMKPFKSMQLGLINLMSELIGFVEDYMFSFFITGRYMFLLFLELMAPVAIMTSLHEPTRQYLYTWIKLMFMCYLLVPGFIIANEFGIQISSVWAQGGYYGFWMLAISLALRLYLYREVKVILKSIFS